MNYNFFGITTDKLKNMYMKRNMSNTLKVLCSDNKMEFNQFKDLNKNKF